MFCGECGTKNDKDSMFCSNCGSKLKTKKQRNNIKVVDSKQKNPIPKKTKIIICIMLIVALLLGICYKIGSDLTSPKKVAEKYIDAVINNKTNILYSYLEIDGDKTFASKKIFSSIMENGSNDLNIVNYKINDVEKNDLSAVVKFTYTVKGFSGEKSDSINLIKQKTKKYFLFDDWRISDLSTDNMIVENYTIKTIKNSKLTFSGVKVDSKYLDEEKSSSSQDVYVLPLVFNKEVKLEVALKNGLKFEKKVTPSVYRNSYTVDFDEDNLSIKEKEELVSSFKVILSDIYSDAINGNGYKSIEPKYKKDNLDLTNLEKNYNNFLNDLMTSNNKLTSISFKEGTIYDINLDENGYFKTKIRVTYDYKVDYTDNNGELITFQSSSYDYFILTLGYNDTKYYLVDINNIETYFSRY